jgi:hypothetical protein
MMKRGTIDEKRVYFFACKKCKKHDREKTEFEFVKYTAHNFVILQCLRCGWLISKKINHLQQQMKEGFL